MARWLAALAVACFASAALWHVTLGQTLTQRIPPGWSWESSYVGFENDPDPDTNGFKPYNRTAYYKRSMAIDDIERSRAVVLRDFFMTSDPESDEVFWEYVLYPQVDPRTGYHLDPDNRHDYAVLPQGLKKRTYILRQSYMAGLPLRFVKEDVVEGLPAYVYYYKGRGEYTDYYEGSEDDPGITVPPGHEIKCGEDQFTFVIWAEPITGETLKIKESCLSGDYLYNIATGKAVKPILRWEGETSALDTVRHAEATRARIRQLQLARHAPLGLGAMGLLLAAAAAMRIRGGRA